MKDAIIYAGYSRDKSGVMRFRTATNEGRIAQLQVLGDEVFMIEINPVYSKADAAKELLRLDHARGVAELEQFYSKFVRDENPFKAKKVRTVTVKQSALAEDKMTSKEAAKVRAEFNAKVKAAYEAN